MVLEFGLLGGQDKTPQTADYRTAGSHQAENLEYELVTDMDQWEEIKVVTTGKTYYVSAVIMSCGVNTTFRIGTGTAASEVDFLVAIAAAFAPVIMEFPTPIKFSSGTRISVRTSTDDDAHFTLIGWEE